MQMLCIVVSCVLFVTSAHAMNNDEQPERAVAVAFSPKTLEVISSSVRTNKDNKRCAFVERYDANTCKSISCFASTALIQQLIKEGDARWDSTDLNKEVPGCVRHILYDPTGEQVALVRHETEGNSLLIYDKNLEKLLHSYACEGEISSLAWEPSFASRWLAFGFAKRTQDGSCYERGYVSFVENAEHCEKITFAIPSCPYPRICMLPDSTIAVVNGSPTEESRNTKIYIYSYKHNQEGEQLTAIMSPQPCILKALAYCPVTKKMFAAGRPLAKGGRAIHLFESIHNGWRIVPSSFGTAYDPFMQYDGLKLLVSADGTKVVLVNPSEKPNKVGVISIFDVQTGGFECSKDAHYLTDASLSHDGKHLASASYNGARVHSIDDSDLNVDGQDSESEEGDEKCITF